MTVVINNLIKLTYQLIKYKTISKNFLEINKSFAFIKKYLKNLKIKEVEHNNIRSLLISNTLINNNIIYDLILHGHIDVVPENMPSQFTPYIKENKIFGRGALDMKGGLACLIELIKNFEKSNKKILLLITSDEEIGGEDGTGYIFNNLKYQGKFFITAEGEKDWLIKIKQKGVLMLKIKSYGKGEHSAYIWKGKNAIIQLFETFQKIRKIFPIKKDPKHWFSTINLGKVYGGVAVNSIPDYAEAEVDIRFCEPWKNYKEIYSKIKKLINNKNIKIEIKYATNLMKSDENNYYIKLLNFYSKKNLGKKQNLFFYNHGTNDARFANNVGIPSVGFGPIGKNYHAKDEYVEIDGLEKYYLILKEFIDQIKSK